MCDYVIFNNKLHVFVTIITTFEDSLSEMNQRVNCYLCGFFGIFFMTQISLYYFLLRQYH